MPTSLEVDSELWCWEAGLSWVEELEDASLGIGEWGRETKQNLADHPSLHFSTEADTGISFVLNTYVLQKKDDRHIREPKAIFLILWVKVKVTQSCLTLCNPIDYTAHGILQAQILEWVASPFSRGSSQPKDWTQVSYIADGFFTHWATGKPKEALKEDKLGPFFLSMEKRNKICLVERKANSEARINKWSSNTAELNSISQLVK